MSPGDGSGRNRWRAPAHGRPSASGSRSRAGGRGAGRDSGSAGRGAGGGDRRASRGGATELGGQQVAGRHAVRELLAAGRRPVREVWLADGAEPSAILDEITELAARASVPVRAVNRLRLREVAETDAPQGVVAFTAPLVEAELGDLAEHPPGAPAPFLVVIDGLTDPHNLGALLRTAQCAGATGVVLARHRAAHVTATVAKAAAGAIEHLPIAVAPGIPSALSRLADAGIWNVGLDARAPAHLWGLPVATEPIAIVLGAEGTGLSRLAKARCQLLVSIPQAGPIESLNVSAAGALACFEVSRARWAAIDTPRSPG